MAQLDRLKTRLAGETIFSDEMLLDILESAKFAILSRRYPFGDFPTEIEDRYKDLQIRIAIEMVNKIGVEGQTAHSENGVSRSYASASISEELLREITPKAGVV